VDENTTVTYDISDDDRPTSNNYFNYNETIYGDTIYVIHLFIFYFLLSFMMCILRN